MGFVGELLSSNGLKLLFAMYSVEPVSCRMSLLFLMAIKMVVSQRDRCLYAVSFFLNIMMMKSIFDSY